MASNNLGRLESVPLRTVWTNEATGFTPWLASEENLAMLSAELGMDLDLEAQEHNVGPFRADILCKDANGDWVLIENQLERTDHGHLGQLLTYAAGLNAKTIVWIAARFTEEHRAALDWINSIAYPNLRAFGVSIELWRIGDSPAAPKFHLISTPNDWSASVAQAAKSIDPTETGARQMEFWRQFRDYLIETRSQLRAQTPQASNWANFAIGKTGVYLVATLNQSSQKVTAHLLMADENAKCYYDQFERQKDQIEAELGFKLTWNKAEDKKRSRLEVSLEGVDPLDESNWPETRAWLKDKLEAMRRVFAQRAKELVVE